MYAPFPRPTDPTPALLLHPSLTGCAAPSQCDAADLALDVFQQMREEGLSPNVVTYNTLVDVYGKRGAWEQAVGVLDDMAAEVGGCGVAAGKGPTKSILRGNDSKVGVWSSCSRLVS